MLTKNFGRQKQFIVFGQIMPKQKMSTVEKISFGEYIRELRESANLPLRKVAAELDIDTSGYFGGIGSSSLLVKVC